MTTKKLKKADTAAQGATYLTLDVSSPQAVVDGGLITGPALVGGATLLYSVGKDVVSYFKPEKKIFVQIVSSGYAEDDTHLIRIRVASMHVHGIVIEKIEAASVDLRVLKHRDSFDFGGRPPPEPLKFPHVLPPSGFVDLLLQFPKTLNAKIWQKGAIELSVSHIALDKPAKRDEAKCSVYLLRPETA